MTREMTESFFSLDEDGTGTVCLDKFMSFWIHNLYGDNLTLASALGTGSELQESVHNNAVHMMPRFSYARVVSQKAGFCKGAAS